MVCSKGKNNRCNLMLTLERNAEGPLSLKKKKNSYTNILTRTRHSFIVLNSNLNPPNCCKIICSCILLILYTFKCICLPLVTVSGRTLDRPSQLYFLLLIIAPSVGIIVATASLGILVILIVYVLMRMCYAVVPVCMPCVWNLSGIQWFYQ